MAALSTGTYGKVSAVTSADLADRITAALKPAHAAIGDLNTAVATGGPVDQAAVNTLLKVVQDLGALATDARQAAADDAAKADRDKADAAAQSSKS
jgi:hypothetical protein